MSKDTTNNPILFFSQVNLKGVQRADESCQQEAKNGRRVKKILVGGSKLTNQYSSSLHCTVVANILVADQLKFVIVFDMTRRLQGQCLFTLVGVYMAPRLCDKCFKFGGSFYYFIVPWNGPLNHRS